jgi:hypothetical protein
MPASERTSVKLVNAALDDASDSPAGLVLRGSLVLSSLHQLRTDDYQREAQPLSSQRKILDALENRQRLPDLDLGMRGESFTSREGSFYLHDPVYIIDGVQRVATIINFMGMRPEDAVSIGATVHFRTTRAWEKLRFHKLNNWRFKLSPNITIRNMREENDAVMALYGLCHNDAGFVLKDRVCWDQRMLRGDLLTATQLVRSAGWLHCHKGLGLKSTGVDALTYALARALPTVGMQNFRMNVKAFFELIDECWGVRAVQYREGAIYMRGNFLIVMAKVLSDHHDFWSGAGDRKLFVNADLRRKIAGFPINDPEVVRLGGSPGKARDLLYGLLRDHINSGRRTRRLSLRESAAVAFDSSEDAAETPVEEAA